MGSTLNKESLKVIKVPVPEKIEDQIHIANLLSKAEELISQRKESIRLLDEFLKEYFSGDVWVPLKNPKFPTVFIENYSIKITDGPHQSPKFIDSGVPFLLVSNIVNNEIDYNTKKFISEQEYQELNKRTPIEKGDLLLTSGRVLWESCISKNNNQICFSKAYCIHQT